MAEDKSQKSDTARKEEEVLAFWQKEHIFEQSLKRPAPKGEFVFYEGPPTANAKPALHHLEARAFKDAIPRYKTMRGYRVRRRAGWDTHGLPVELQIEKELGFSGKPDIEKYGVEAFNEKCRESVYRYISVWEEFTDRLGYWVDKKDAYYTFDATYMESLWSIVKKVAGDGRLYKDYKVVPWCSRCGTALSSHEIAQGYKDVKDLSVTAKFRLLHPEKLGLSQPTFVLAWTTTPWTLPGNVALAVGPEIEYVYVQQNDEVLIVAKERAAALGLDAKNATSIRGRELVGLQYESLYEIPKVKEYAGKKWQVLSADFVTTEDGTGIVHTAVMYGADDFDLGTKEGLPKVHLVRPDATYTDDVTHLTGRSVLDEETTIDIIKDLAHRGLLFSKEKYEHSYPFCWRCSTRLIYYARDSWYIRMTELRDTLIAENKKIHWEPAHIRDGRFGEWLSGVKDWAISRERYWGTPLPVWQSADGKEQLVVGSVEELKAHTKKSGNTYYVMRHGESEKNVKDIISYRVDDGYHLTEKGKADAARSAEGLKGAHITRVVASPLVRTQETARVVCEVLGLPQSIIKIDERLRDYENGPAFEGKSEASWWERYPDPCELYTAGPEGGESIREFQKRIGEALYDIEHTYTNEVVLVVTHGWPAAMLTALTQGADKEKTCKILAEYHPNGGIKPAEVQKLDFVPLPHNRNYELDLHKPYIDQVVLLSASGKELRRTNEVMDVWFDSGAMPFAQEHYPFENKQLSYPADFISEAIDQTRGWFYTLLAVGVLMGRGTPYKNVICLGHLLDATGAKMSKSKGNVIEPFSAMDEYGADLIRYWMYSVNAPGEGKSFDPKVLQEMKNKVFNPLVNSVQFYEMYKGEERVSEASVLDQWMQARLDLAVRSMTEALDRYDMYAATREFRDLVGDVSLWYVRRSRDRLKEEGDDARAARAMLRHTLLTIAKLSAPFTPFLAEQLYQKLRAEADPVSVHLADWPEVKGRGFFSSFFAKKDTLLTDMEEVRALVTAALDVRQKSGIKVRQPLSELKVKSEKLLHKQDLLQIIADEVNVKKVHIDNSMSDTVQLDTTITVELKEEGELRDLIREVQDLRKQAGLSPKDQAVLTVPSERLAFVEKHMEHIRRAAQIVRVQEGTLNVSKA